MPSGPKLILGYFTKKITKTDPSTGEEVVEPGGAVPGVVGVRHLPDRRRPRTDRLLPAAHGDGPAGALDQLTTLMTAEGLDPCSRSRSRVGVRATPTTSTG